MSPLELFMSQAKAKAEQMSVRMAKLELSSWSDQTEAQNKQHYGFTDKSLAKRKKALKKIADQ